MQRFLNEFNRLCGVGSTYAEQVSGSPKAVLRVLSKAFSMPVKQEDLKFLRYRRVGNGVELEDRASRLGGILPSVETAEMSPDVLIRYLKKYGAKAFKAEDCEELPPVTLAPRTKQ